MQHPEFKEKVDQAFAAEHPKPSKKERLSLHCAVAAKLLEAEDNATKTRMKKESEAEHELLMEEHKAALQGVPSANGEDQEL